MYTIYLVNAYSCRNNLQIFLNFEQDDKNDDLVLISASLHKKSGCTATQFFL
jgi:hypothetical protein